MTKEMFKNGLLFISLLAMVAVFAGCGANNTANSGNTDTNII